MNILVIYPGRFHPFHRGHQSSYDWLVNKFGPGVYVATSDVQDPETSPFNYSEKVKMMTKLGIPASHIVRVKNPYQAKEITDSLGSEERADTALIFAVSAKDAERFNFKPKKDGSPSYLQPLPDNTKKLKPMTQAGYVVITPTVNFRVRGVDANSASQIRKIYKDASDADRANIITDLYGAPDAELTDIFNNKLASKQDEIITYGTPIVDGGTVDGGMRESRVNRATLQQLKERIRSIKQQIQEAHQLDYIDEKNHH